MNLDELAELAGKATPGPWCTVGNPWLPPNCETYIVAGNGDPHVSQFVCDFLDAALAGVEDKYQDDEWSAINDANAAYIAACPPETILALVRVAKAAEEFVAVAGNQLHPTPDKPNTAWSKMRATAEALDALRRISDAPNT